MPEDRSVRGNRRIIIAGLAVLAAAIIVVVIFVISFHGLSYVTRSGSMEPTLPIGSSFSVKTEPLKLGEIVVFHPPTSQLAQRQCANPAQGFSVGGVTAKRQPCDRAGAQEQTAEVQVKRIVGLPGDRLRIVDGQVYRNGQRERPYTERCRHSECTFTQAITVPAGEYYVMGDNRGDSDDSRFFGPLRAGWITGVVVSCSHSTPYCTRG